MTQQELKEYRHYLIERLNQTAESGLKITNNIHQMYINEIIFNSIKNELLRINKIYIQKVAEASDKETIIHKKKT